MIPHLEGQETPSTQVWFSTSSPTSTTPRDPRVDPQAGDVLERAAGIAWRVVDREGLAVLHELVGNEGRTSRVTLSHWQRLFVELSARSWAGLKAMGRARDGAGWVRPAHREELMRAASIGSRNTWAKVQDELEAAGVVVVDRPTKASGRPTHYRLTALGIALVSSGEPGGSAPEPGLSQVGEPGLSQGTPEGLSSSFSKGQDEIPHSQAPGPIQGTLAQGRTAEPGVSQGVEPGGVAHDPRLARAITAACEAFARAWLSPEQNTDSDEAAAAPRDPATPRRRDGLRWDEREHPDFAAELARFRDAQTTRDDAIPWELSRKLPAAWCMRAYAHAAWRLLRPLKDARPVHDAWGIYIDILRKLAKAQGDGGKVALEFAAMDPDAERAWRTAFDALAERDHRAARRERLDRSPAPVPTGPTASVEETDAAMREAVLRMVKAQGITDPKEIARRLKRAGLEPTPPPSAKAKPVSAGVDDVLTKSLKNPQL